jgi:hypothetical protein
MRAQKGRVFTGRSIKRRGAGLCAESHPSPPPMGPRVWCSKGQHSAVRTNVRSAYYGAATRTLVGRIRGSRTVLSHSALIGGAVRISSPTYE